MANAHARQGRGLWGLLGVVFLTACSTARRPSDDATDGARSESKDGAPESGKGGCRITPVVELPPLEGGSLGGGAEGGAACGDVVTSIIHETCVGGICHHKPPGQAGHLDLLSPCVADRLVGKVSSCHGRLLVDPKAPEQSFVLEKLEHDMPECGGESMPFDNHLPEHELECMRRWVFAIAAAR